MAEIPQDHEEYEETRQNFDDRRERNSRARSEQDSVSYGGYIHPLTLLPSDNLGLTIVGCKLTDVNYVMWSHAMRRALSAKNKLGFVTGTVVKPPEGDDGFEQWSRVNDTVVSWILNSMSDELLEGYHLTENACDLWNELKDRFGVSNGPQIYQLKREISSIRQGNASLAVYYTKLKKLWDELIHVDPPDVCTCGKCVCAHSKASGGREARDKLMQFLTGLNDSYLPIKNQILATDPLPDVKRAYSMIMNVERQHLVQMVYDNGADHSALMSQTYVPHNQQTYQGSDDQAAMLAQKSTYGTGNRPYFGNMNRENELRRDKAAKKLLKCDYCNMNGHTRADCFKLIGYPEWWRPNKDSRMQPFQPSGKISAHLAEGSIDSVSYEDAGELKGMMGAIKVMMQQELAKMLKGKEPTTENEHINFAHFTDFAGAITAAYSTMV